MWVPGFTTRWRHNPADWLQTAGLGAPDSPWDGGGARGGSALTGASSKVGTVLGWGRSFPTKLDLWLACCFHPTVHTGTYAGTPQGPLACPLPRGWGSGLAGPCCLVCQWAAGVRGFHCWVLCLKVGQPSAACEPSQRIQFIDRVGVHPVTHQPTQQEALAHPLANSYHHTHQPASLQTGHTAGHPSRSLPAWQQLPEMPRNPWVPISARWPVGSLESALANRSGGGGEFLLPSHQAWSPLALRLASGLAF